MKSGQEGAREVRARGLSSVGSQKATSYTLYLDAESQFYVSGKLENRRKLTELLD